MDDAAADHQAAPDEKRRRILRAAEQVCLSVGVAAARMDEIAAEAQVSKGTLYRHFEGKDDLLVAMVIEGFEAGQRSLDASFPGHASAGAQLDHLLEGLVGVLAAHGPRATLHYAAWGAVTGEPHLRQRLEAHLRRFFEAREEEIFGLLEAGRADGDFRAAAEPRSFASAILALVSGFVFRSAFDPVGASPDRLRAAFAALVDGTLRGAPAAEEVYFRG